MCIRDSFKHASQAHSGSSASFAEHHDRADPTGQRHRQRALGRPDPDRVGDADWRLLRLCSDNAEQRRRSDQYSRRIVGNRQRYSDSQLHARRVQFHRLHQRQWHKHGGRHLGDAHSHSNACLLYTSRCV